jgi:hypothetical protein
MHILAVAFLSDGSLRPSLADGINSFSQAKPLA